MHHPSTLELAADEWSAFAIEQGWPHQWVEGAIYCREMIFFLAMCEANGIDYIIESGRQDGFSTMILGEYAKKTGKTVVSIDYEDDPKRAEACHRRLAGYPVDLQVGDAFVILPKLLRETSGRRVGLLFDGPKGWAALSLLLAATSFPSVSLLAMHNLAEHLLPVRYYFEGLSDQPAFYEALLKHRDGAWEAVGIMESEFAAQLGGVRSTDVSSLGVVPIVESRRREFAQTTARPFGLFQPALISAGWSRSYDRAVAQLFSQSFKWNTRLAMIKGKLRSLLR
jgi:hypothetical protein